MIVLDNVHGRFTLIRFSCFGDAVDRNGFLKDAVTTVFFVPQDIHDHVLAEAEILSGDLIFFCLQCLGDHLDRRGTSRRSVLRWLLLPARSPAAYPAFFDRSERTLNTHARLDELLHERNMTLYQLCQSGNIPYTTLRVSRCRGSQLSVDTIEQICRVLGISMAEFFTPSNQVRTH